MIICPICNISNDDLARFCAECGQRLGPNEPQGQSGFASPAGQAVPPVPPATPVPPVQVPPAMPQQQAPVPPAVQSFPNNPPPVPQPSANGSPPPPKPKLRSPMLGADDFDDEPQPIAKPMAGGRAKPLRSPLLGGDDDDFEEPVPPQGKRGLKSPLLGGDSGHDNSDQPTSGSKPKKFRSPLLGDSNEDDEIFDEPRSGSKSKHSLHSPLLGGAEESHSHFPHRKGSFPSSDDEPGEGSGKPGGLRSPFLNGGSSSSHFDDYEEDELEDYSDDPNVLRSPLLAARRHVEKPPVQPVLPPSAPPANTQAPAMPPAPPFQPAAPMPQAQTMPQAPAMPQSPPPVQQAPPVQQLPFTPQAPAMPQVTQPAQPPNSLNFPPEMPPSAPTPGVNFNSGPSGPKPMTPEFSEPPVPQWGNVSANVHTHPSRPADEIKPQSVPAMAPPSVQAPPANPVAPPYQPEELNALRFPQSPKPVSVQEESDVPEPTRPRFGSKMLGDTHEDEDLSHRGSRFATTESRSGGGSIAPACAVPLFLALAMKLWVMFEIFKTSQLSGIVMMDNIAQVLVILALLALCLMGFKNK